MLGIGRSVSRIFLELAKLPPPPAFFDGTASVLAIAALRVYRVLLSRVSGRICMFRPSCSEFALNTLVDVGWTRGRSLIATRLRQCDGNYVLLTIDGRVTLQSSDGCVHEEESISTAVLKQVGRSPAGNKKGAL